MGNLLQRALSGPMQHVGYTVEILTGLASLWPNDAETDVASTILLVNGAVVLKGVANASALSFAEGPISSDGVSLLKLLSHIAEGGIVGQRLDAHACFGAATAAKDLSDAQCKSLDVDGHGTRLTAAGQMACLAAQSSELDSLEAAADVLQRLLHHAKSNKNDACIKCIRTIRALADMLLCNKHSTVSLRERVASLGIPSEDVSTDDVSLLWWILQLNPRVLGVNVQTVDCMLSKRLIATGIQYGLIEHLSQICLGARSTKGDGQARHHSMALLMHFARVSEPSSMALCEQCFEEAGAWSTEDLFKSAPIMCMDSVRVPEGKEQLELMTDLQERSEGPQTMIWMALCIWFPCSVEGTRACIVRKTFPLIAATLMKMLARRNSTCPSWDSSPYADYLLRWYISTDGEFVNVAGFFHLVCALLAPPDYVEHTDKRQEIAATLQSSLFLHAAAIALDRFNAACHVPPPGRMWERAIGEVRNLMSKPCLATGNIIAKFFSSALCCHRPIVRVKAVPQELNNVTPCYAFLVSQVFPEVWIAIGEPRSEEVKRLVESGATKARVCRAIEKRLVKTTSACGGA
jgi:hypothetical protein